MDMAISHCTFYAASRWGKQKKKETENVHCGRLRNGAFCCFWPSSRLSFLYMFQSRFGIILQICIYISLAYIKSIFHPTSWSVGRPSKLHHVSVCECWWFILFGHMCVFHYGHLYWCRIGVCVVECAGVCVCVCEWLIVWVWQSTSRRGKTREAHPKISFAARDRVCNEKCVGYDRKTSDAEGQLPWCGHVGDIWGCEEVQKQQQMEHEVEVLPPG